jgi:hypothetical protein
MHYKRIISLGRPKDSTGKWWSLTGMALIEWIRETALKKYNIKHFDLMDTMNNEITPQDVNEGKFTGELFIMEHPDNSNEDGDVLRLSKEGTFVRPDYGKRLVKSLYQRLDDIEKVLNMCNGRRIYHGGCLDCTTDQSLCRGCQYASADWGLPNFHSKAKERK